jgi:hypothetical protein
MKILIGTPIHEMKDYCMERWLENVSQLQRTTPADVLLVDNSASMEYVKIVERYCEKYAIQNCTIDHFEVQNASLNPDKARNVNVEIAQEMIRQKTLKENYDAWFSWECDQIVPNDTLNQLIQLKELGNCMMVVANSWARSIPGELNANMGVTLIGKEALKKGWFLPFDEGTLSFNLADFYNVDETMFKKRVLKAGGNYIEVYGVIEPIYHLNN